MSHGVPKSHPDRDNGYIALFSSISEKDKHGSIFQVSWKQRANLAVF